MLNDRMAGIFYRLNLLRAHFSHKRDFPSSPLELLRVISKDSYTRLGPSYIKDVTEDGGFLVVRFRDLETALYWPCALPMHDLYHVLPETFDARHWHFYEVPQTRVSPGDVVLDCGAAEGIFALRVLSKAGRVVLFEPSPVFHQALNRTFANFDHVEIVPAALGEKESEAFLEGSSLYGHVNSLANGIPIRVTTIDDWASQAQSRIDYIKADVEGFEMALLRGAQATIRLYRPKIALTVYHPGNEWREMVHFVRSLLPGYRYCVKGLSCLEPGRARPVMLHLWPV